MPLAFWESSTHAGRRWWGGFEQVRAEGAASVQLRLQRVTQTQQCLHPRHDPLLFGQWRK
jgi:hypothetical protein